MPPRATLLLAIALAAVAAPAGAQTCGPCLTPLRGAPEGEIEAAAELGSPVAAILALVGDRVLRTVDEGRRWVTVLLLEELPEDAPCGPTLAASGRRVLVLAGDAVHLSGDGGQSFTTAPSPFDEGTCAAALDEAGGALVPAPGGLARFAADAGGLEPVELVELPFEPELVAAGGGRLAVASGGRLAVLDRGPGRPSPARLVDHVETVLALAVDDSGDVWLATGSGVSTLGPDGTAGVALARSLPAEGVDLASAEGREPIVLVGGRLARLSRRCPCAAGPPPPALPPPGRPRRYGLRGLLPDLEVRLAASTVRRALWVGVTWPLPGLEPGVETEWAEHSLRAFEDRRGDALARDAAWARWLAGRRTLAAPWPPTSGLSGLEHAVDALAGRAEASVLAAHGAP